MLVLQKPTKTIHAQTGEASESWANVGLVYAEVMPQSGTETTENNQQSAKMGYKVRVNYRSDINPSRRFLMDDLVGQLNGAINASVTAITVDDSAFTEIKQARRVRALRIDDEFLTLTASSGNTLTVTRGAFGSVAATHADDSKVILYRQLNIGNVYDPDNRRSDLVCECTEVV